ncbi:MAG: septum formation initiator family protein [Actinobacteria bacterium]|nr:MAG: septum formation initiator family protein [Actinomycetota bacterium]TMK91207.1 MAG: septum formation initiator family protein [Actinomycetota bacterium]
MSARATATSPAAARGDDRKGPSGHSGRVRLTPRASILLFAVFVVAVFAVAPTRAYLLQRSELQGLQRQADELQQQNTELERRIADLNDPSTLERLARECLGMVKPGEIAFVPIPKGGAPTLPDCG